MSAAPKSIRIRMRMPAAQLQAEMAARNQRIADLAAIAPLPWHTDLVKEPGVVFGPRDEIILVVDYWRDTPDAHVHLIAQAVVDAVNAMFPVPELADIDPSAGYVTQGSDAPDAAAFEPASKPLTGRFRAGLATTLCASQEASSAQSANTSEGHSDATGGSPQQPRGSDEAHHDQTGNFGA